MDVVKEEKQDIIDEITKKMGALTKDIVSAKSRAIEKRLFEFANFIESYVVLLYLNQPGEADTKNAIEASLGMNKIVVLPPGDADNNNKDLRLLKLNNLQSDIISGPGGKPCPDPTRCRVVPISSIELALVPGLVFDEKGARIGMDTGFYEKLIPKLPATTRKVSLAFEDQIIQQVPKTAIDRHVDIIITEDRVIYKI